MREIEVNEADILMFTGVEQLSLILLSDTELKSIKSELELIRDRLQQHILEVTLHGTYPERANEEVSLISITANLNVKPKDTLKQANQTIGFINDLLYH